MTLDELAQAVWGARIKHLFVNSFPAWVSAGDDLRQQCRAESLVVAETLLNYLAVLADDERLDGHELRAVLAEIKGETT